ncbi:MAG: 8-oxo-dGDP phosphatase [Actinomycetota bacterium]|jgi:ADP-ribose pyrophosphatase|nr:8-oxo-dGDP phosphatase [Actinomycetota bacterium]
MAHDYEVLDSARVYEGGVIAVRRDELSMPGDTTAVRDVVEHPGAVAIVALDDQHRVVVVRQYRHPVGRPLDELPAGLLDVDGEPAHETAKRELAEEAGLAADRWHVLVDLLTTPGMSTEAARIYLARGLHEVDRDIQGHEEAEMTSDRVPMAHLVAGILEGVYENALLVAGVLAASHAAAGAFAGLRPVDAPWRARPQA